MTIILIRILQFFWGCMAMLALASAVAIALSGCATLPTPTTATNTKAPKPTDDVFYRATLPVRVDDDIYNGILSLQRRVLRNIEIDIPDDTYYFSIINCHGENPIITNPDAGWYTWKFRPVLGLENFGSCIAIATALGNKGETYQAIIDWNDGHELPASIKCNRERIDAKGAAICQSRAQTDGPSLVQRIDFEVPTVWAAPEHCPPPRRSDWIHTYWEIDIAPGFCVYKFMDERKRQFRLTTYGYTDDGTAQPRR